MNREPVNEHFVKWERQLRKGLLTYLVLGELKRNKHYGYSLIATLSSAMNAEMAEGTIYPLLSRLERDAMIESDWQIQPSGPARKYYRITPQGRDLLATMNEHWRDINDRLKGIADER